MTAFLKSILSPKLIFILENRNIDERLNQIQKEKQALIDECQKMLNMMDKQKIR